MPVSVPTSDDTLPSADASIDLGQLGCGDMTPAIRQRMRDMASGQVLEVISQEPAAHEGIPAWSRLTGNALIGTVREAGRSRFLLRKK